MSGHGAPPHRHATLPDGRVVLVYDTPADLALAGAGMVADALAAAAAARGHATLALSGGGTPRRLYERLAAAHRDDAPWRQTTVVFGDERCVPPDHPASNYRLARETLLAPLPLAPERVHRAPGELPPAAAAAAYERTLRLALATGGAAAAPDERPAAALGAPVLDVTLLGMGVDGHTASLFPQSPALAERTRWVVPVTPPATASPPLTRVTLTLPVLAASRLILMLVAGAEKQGAVGEALREARDGGLPAARVRALGQTRWLLDAAAAADLPWLHAPGARS